jgi:hypothetical protein
MYPQKKKDRERGLVNVEASCAILHGQSDTHNTNSDILVHVRCEVLMAMNMKITVLDVTLHSLVGRYQHLGGIYKLQLLLWRWEAAGSSKTVTSFYQTR